MASSRSSRPSSLATSGPYVLTKSISGIRPASRPQWQPEAALTIVVRRPAGSPAALPAGSRARGRAGRRRGGRGDLGGRYRRRGRADLQRRRAGGEVHDRAVRAGGGERGREEDQLVEQVHE